MAGNKKPRKAYKPRTPPGMFRLPINIRYAAHNETALQLVPQTELDKLRDGTADQYTVNTLAFRLNWGYVMAGEYFDTPEARTAMEEALAAIRSVKARFERTGKYGCTGQEFNQLGDGLNLTDEMQKMTTRKQQHEALTVVSIVNKDKRKGKSCGGIS